MSIFNILIVTTIGGLMAGKDGAVSGFLVGLMAEVIAVAWEGK